MTDSHPTPSQALPPHAQLIEIDTAYWVSGVVHAAAKLGLADQIALCGDNNINWSAQSI